jgi:hypothetical protein
VAYLTGESSLGASSRSRIVRCIFANNTPPSPPELLARERASTPYQGQNGRRSLSDPEQPTTDWPVGHASAAVLARGALRHAAAIASILGSRPSRISRPRDMSLGHTAPDLSRIADSSSIPMI